MRQSKSIKGGVGVPGWGQDAVEPDTVKEKKIKSIKIMKKRKSTSHLANLLWRVYTHTQKKMLEKELEILLSNC